MRVTLLLISLLLLGFARAGNAQTADESTKQRLRSQYLQNDTAQAIINLYSRRQAGGAGWIGGGILAVTRAALAGGGSDNNSFPPRQDPGVAPYFIAASPFVAYGTSKLVRFSNGSLEKTLWLPTRPGSRCRAVCAASSSPNYLRNRLSSTSR